MTRRFNTLIDFGPTGTVEVDLATCGHCQFQMRVKPPKDAHIICRVDSPCPGCDKFICQTCKDAGGPCKTWEKKMEESEARAKLLESILG